MCFKKIEGLIFEVEVKSTKTAKFIVLENFPLYSMYVCMYVYMYVCMYVRTYVRTYVRMYVCMYVRTYVCI